VNKAEKAVADLERCPHCGAVIEVYARSCPTCGRDVVEEKLSIFKKQRDAGAMTEAAFDVAERLLREPDVELVETLPRPAIRKQVTDLRPDDLERFSIWEFALDEEGEQSQDEATVRPRPDLQRADPGEGMFVIRAEFVAADGTRFDGFVSPHEEASVTHTQPTIVTNAGQVNFWFGLFPPGPGAVEGAYRTLGKSAAELFPVRYRALVEHGGAVLDGEVQAFLHHKSGDDTTVIEIT
jgi:hypothetical protein